MKKIRGWLALLLAFSLLLTGIMVPQPASAAKKKPKLSKKSASVKVGGKVKIKVKNTKKKVKWSVKSGKKYIKLTNTKKKTVTVKGRKAGTAKIIAKVGNKKLPCKIKVKKKGSNTGKKPSKDKDGATGVPGKEIKLPAGATVFQAGGHKLALGIKTSDVKTVFGSMSTDVMREEKSPQGFDVIAYNPGGKYDGYTLVYLKNDVVVGLCAIGKNVSYGNVVKTGTAANALGAGWSPETLFDAKEGEATVGSGAYKYTAASPSATVLAYVDYFRKNGNKVYCIQVYSNAISRKNMLDPNTCNYDDAAVMTAMKIETAELLNAYCTYVGFRTLKTVGDLADVAQAFCDTSITKTDDPPERGNEALMTAILAKSNEPLHFAEITLSMSSDSIGFANSVLEQEACSDYIIKLSYIDQHANGQKYPYSYQYFGIGAAAYKPESGSSRYTYMVIDLVDLW